MDKVYTDLQFTENEFFRAYNLALNMAGSVEGMKARVQKIRAESDHEESELYQELQKGIEADGTEMNVELLRKQYAVKRTKVLEAATIKLRAVALGR